jgi:hypothetical protein
VVSNEPADEQAPEREEPAGEQPPKLEEPASKLPTVSKKPAGVQPAEPLVPPHPSEIKPSTPAADKSIRHADFALAELAELFAVVEAGARRGVDAEGLVRVSWINGGETATTAEGLKGIAKPEAVRAVNSYMIYGDYSTSWLNVVFPGRGKAAVVQLYWHGTGTGRRRAETIEGRLGGLRESRKLAAFLVRRGVAQVVSWIATLAVLVVVFRLVPDVNQGPWSILFPAIIGAIVGGPCLAGLSLLLLNGKLVGDRPKHDWQAIGTMLGAGIAAVAAVISAFK